MGPLEWVALGMALANRPFQQRLTAEVPTEAFGDRHALELFRSLGTGREGQALESLGLQTPPGGKLGEALVHLLRLRGWRLKAQATAQRIADAAKFAEGQTYLDYVAKELAGLSGLAATLEVQGGGQSNGPGTAGNEQTQQAAGGPRPGGAAAGAGVPHGAAPARNGHAASRN